MSAAKGSTAPNIPKEVVVGTRAVLLSSSKGVPLKRFCRDYRNLVGVGFPWRKNGYPSFVAMLEAMPDVVRFKLNRMTGEQQLFGIGREDMYMPSWVVKAQGDTSSLYSAGPCSRQGSKQRHRNNGSLQNRHSVTNNVRAPSQCDRAGGGVAGGCPNATLKGSTIRDLPPDQPPLIQWDQIPQRRSDGDRSHDRSHDFKEELCHQTGPVKHYTMLEYELGLVSESSDDDSLFEWDDSLLDQPFDDHGVPMLENTEAKLEDTGAKLEDTGAKLERRADMKFENASCSSSVVSPAAWHSPKLPRPLIGSSFSPSRTPSSNLMPRPSPSELPHPSSSSIEHGQLIPVTVSKVVSPDEIWLQMTSDPERELDSISTCIVQHNPSRLKKVELGAVCCIDLNSYTSSRNAAHQSKMRRALIRDNQEKHAGLLLIDVGISMEYLARDLLTLPPSLSPSCVPPLALPCCLHGIAPTKTLWFQLDIQLLWKSIYSKKVYMRKVTAAKSTACSKNLVELYFDPSGQKSVADTMVMEGFEVQRRNENETLIKQNGMETVEQMEEHETEWNWNGIQTSGSETATTVRGATTESASELTTPELSTYEDVTELESTDGSTALESEETRATNTGHRTVSKVAVKSSFSPRGMSLVNRALALLALEDGT